MFPIFLLAQEFDCEVSVNDEQLEGTSFNYAAPALVTLLEDYINNYRWTDINFDEQERLKCQINVILARGDDNYNFTAESVFQFRRPVYGTTFETTTLIVNDQSWIFNFQEGKTIRHDDQQFEALASYIDYFCYLMLGYDFDTFSPLGGTEYFNKAQNVVDLAQNADAVGWSQNINNRRNKFVLISDLLSTNFEPLRQAYYEYHREILDTFTESPEESRQQLIAVLNTLLDSKRRATSTYLFDLFFGTKSREITSIFEEGDIQVKLEAYNALSDVDPAHLTDYEELQN